MKNSFSGHNDGDIKIKDGDTKTKIDGETGEKKVKKD